MWIRKSKNLKIFGFFFDFKPFVCFTLGINKQRISLTITGNDPIFARKIVIWKTLQNPVSDINGSFESIYECIALRNRDWEFFDLFLPFFNKLVSIDNCESTTVRNSAGCEKYIPYQFWIILIYCFDFFCPSDTLICQKLG